MSVTPKAILQAKQIENSQTTQYTSTGVRTIIDKCSATNTTGSNVTFSVNLVTQSGTAGAANLIISSKTVVPGETYLCPEIVGHVLNPGDFISTIAGTATALTVRISGREVA